MSYNAASTGWCAAPTTTKRNCATRTSPTARARSTRATYYLQRQIDNRRDQIAEVSSPGGKTPGRKVSRNEAHSFQMRIDDDIKDLRWDFFAIFENYDKLNKERRSVASLKKNLKARKDWLAENDK